MPTLATRTCLSLALMLLVISPLVAGADEYGREGAYGTFQLSAAHGSGSIDTNSAGLGLRLGVFVNDILAVEMQWDWIALSSHLVTYNMKLSPLTGRFQPYALVGAGIVSPLDGKSTLFGAYRTGIGIDMFINDNWSIGSNVDWVDTMVDQRDIEAFYFGVGTSYHF